MTSDIFNTMRKKKAEIFENWDKETDEAMLQRFKDARIEDKLLRKQFVKGCRKISIAFKGVVEEDEDLENDLKN